MGILLLRTRKRWLFAGVLALIIGAVCVGVVLHWDRIADFFQLFLRDAMGLSGRDKVYVNGVKQLLESPGFGGSFYPRAEYAPFDWAELEDFSSFFPPRWHNTLVQIGASCGLVGLAAYAFHRYQTIRLLLTQRSDEKLFVTVSLTVLLAASMLDCHFFNVGPAMFYSMALAFAERIGETELA